MTPEWIREMNHYLWKEAWALAWWRIGRCYARGVLSRARLDLHDGRRRDTAWVSQLSLYLYEAGLR